LREAVAHQDILGHVTIHLSTDCPGGEIGNIPFPGITNPADATSEAAAKANIAKPSSRRSTQQNCSRGKRFAHLARHIDY
jgi:hypothetical protein